MFVEALISRACSRPIVYLRRRLCTHVSLLRTSGIGVCDRGLLHAPFEKKSEPADYRRRKLAAIVPAEVGAILPSYIPLTVFYFVWFWGHATISTAEPFTCFFHRFPDGCSTWVLENSINVFDWGGLKRTADAHLQTPSHSSLGLRNICRNLLYNRVRVLFGGEGGDAVCGAEDSSFRRPLRTRRMAPAFLEFSTSCAEITSARNTARMHGHKIVWEFSHLNCCHVALCLRTRGQGAATLYLLTSRNILFTFASFVRKTHGDTTGDTTETHTICTLP